MKCELVTVHEGDGTDIVGYFLLTEDESKDMWFSSNYSDQWDYIAVGNDMTKFTQFDHIKDLIVYMQANNVEIIHESAIGAY